MCSFLIQNMLYTVRADEVDLCFRSLLPRQPLPSLSLHDRFQLLGCHRREVATDQGSLPPVALLGFGTAHLCVPVTVM